jgi:hypothetical protein
MTPTRFLAAAALAALAAAAAAQAAQGQDAGTARPAKAHAPTLAASASHQLRADDVPSARTDPASAKVRADADLAARDARPKLPRVQVQRENLKGDDARRALAQRANPNSIDRATAYGDKDHTEQVTDWQITLKK